MVSATLAAAERKSVQKVRIALPFLPTRHGAGIEQCSAGRVPIPGNGENPSFLIQRLVRRQPSLSANGQRGVHRRTLAWKLIAGRLNPAEEFPA
jgi:hypothetical protein